MQCSLQEKACEEVDYEVQSSSESEGEGEGERKGGREREEEGESNLPEEEEEMERQRALAVAEKEKVHSSESKSFLYIIPTPPLIHESLAHLPMFTSLVPRPSPAKRSIYAGGFCTCGQLCVWTCAKPARV